MQMKSKWTLSCLGLLLFTHFPAALAHDEYTSACHELDVQVVNKTSSECMLQSYKMGNGYFLNIDPNIISIPAGSSQTIATEQGRAYGPSIELIYNCNGKKISFLSQQNFCYMMAGSVKGEIRSKDPGVDAEFVANTGSFFWNYPGKIYWALIEKQMIYPDQTSPGTPNQG